MSQPVDDFESDTPVVAYFPEVHDLAVSKLVAGRPHDRAFVEALSTAGLVDGQVLVERARLLDNEVDAVRRHGVMTLAEGVARRAHESAGQRAQRQHRQAPPSDGTTHC